MQDPWGFRDGVRTAERELGTRGNVRRTACDCRKPRCRDSLDQADFRGQALSTGFAPAIGEVGGNGVGQRCGRPATRYRCRLCRIRRVSQATVDPVVSRAPSAETPHRPGPETCDGPLFRVAHVRRYQRDQGFAFGIVAARKSRSHELGVKLPQAQFSGSRPRFPFPGDQSQKIPRYLPDRTRTPFHRALCGRPPYVPTLVLGAFQRECRRLARHRRHMPIARLDSAMQFHGHHFLVSGRSGNVRGRRSIRSCHYGPRCLRNSNYPTDGRTDNTRLTRNSACFDDLATQCRDGYSAAPQHPSLSALSIALLRTAEVSASAVPDSIRFESP